MKKFLLTTLLVLVTVVAAFAQNELTATLNCKNSSLTPASLKVTDSEGNIIATIVCEKGQNTQNSPKANTGYMTIYQGNTMKFTAVEGCYLKKIDLTCSSQYCFVGEPSWSNGAFSKSPATNPTIGTWTAEENSNVSEVICNTNKDTSKKSTRVTEIKITYTKAEKQEFNVTNSDVIVTYNPNSPKLDLSENLPAEILENATLTFTGADAYIESDGTIKASNADAEGDQTVNVAWTETATYKANNHDFSFLIDKAEAALAYSAETATATMGEAAELPALSNPYSLTVEYTSLDENVATVGADGVVELVGPGETTIEAAFSGDELFNKGAVEYTLTVQKAGAPAVPTFSFENGSTHFIDETLSLATTTLGASILFSLDGKPYSEYIDPIEFTEAKKYSVYAYTKKDAEESEKVNIEFTIAKREYAYSFGEVAEQMVGRDRYFTMPQLTGADGVEVKYEATGDGVVVKNPGSAKGLEDAYFIIGAGTAVVKATIAEDETHDVFTKTMDVTIVPEVTKIEKTTSQDFDFTDYTKLNLKSSDISGSGSNARINLTGELKTLTLGSVSITFEQNDGTVVPQINTYSNYMSIYKPKSGKTSGGSMTVTANGITKIEISFSQNPANIGSTTGVFKDAVNNVRTWTPEAGVESVSSVEFQNNTSGNHRITNIKVYYTEVTEGGEAHVKSNMDFSYKEYDLEEGDLMPNVVLPDDFEGEVKYLVNGEPVGANYRFPKEGIYTIEAYTEGDSNYLPAVATANVIANGYELESYLTIHYSTDEGMHYANCQTVTGTEGRYEFKDIEVKGYDGVDGKYYGHVFFSFYQAPSETPALAPRREAAVVDWASFNAANVIYTPEEHLAMAGANTTLVRNRANTLGETMPAVLRVPATNDTQKALNFTVQLDKLGTSNVTVSEGTQTGVESVGVDADGEAEYYTLQGVRVAKPAAGIYLRRQGGTVSKVLVK